MGYGVNDGEEFPERIRRALAAMRTGIPVINAGIGDNGNGRWVKLLRNEGNRLDPRLVVLQVSDNDFTDNLKDGLFTIGPSGDLVERSVPPPGWSRVVQQWIEAVPGLPYSYLVGLSRQAISARRVRTPASPLPTASAQDVARADSLTYGLIGEAVDICQQQGWRVLALEVGVEGARLEALRTLFQKRGVNLIVVPSRADRPDLYYRTDGHWNARGHEWVATKVLEYLRTAGVLNN
jgi:hypothetical protein